MPADEEAAIRRTAAWAVRKLRAKKRWISVRTLEPRESRLWLGETYESVKRLLYAYSEDDEADGPSDEPWHVLSFYGGEASDPLSERRAYHAVFSETTSGGVFLERRLNGKLVDVPLIRAERTGEGCVLELIVEGDLSRPTRERYLVLIGGATDDGEAIRTGIRSSCRTQCGLPWIWGGRVELDDATIIPSLLRVQRGYRRLTLKLDA
ncbi:MAG TPA: hypothetical protein VGN57_23370 [Pirellulaceae bacterium]|jgi:hypothetical protein|nr:hypothetical protein [Pirellulaceae bacterium]